MFSQSDNSFFDKLPEILGLKSVEAKRILTRLYLELLAIREHHQVYSKITVDEVKISIKRLSVSLQLYALSISNEEHSLRTASAFIAALGLEILSEIESFNSSPATFEKYGFTRLEHPVVSNAIESGLLYLIAGFDSNAKQMARIAMNIERYHFRGRVDVEYVENFVDNLLSLLSNKYSQSKPVSKISQSELISIGLGRIERTQQEIYQVANNSICEYSRWIRMQSNITVSDIINPLNEVEQVLVRSGADSFASQYHLVKLIHMAILISSRRAVRNLPLPKNSAWYLRYIERRVLERQNYWPSCDLFVEKCLPGMRRNAVVTLPTGSGKSFIAELAISHSLDIGSIVYIVPTNALARQVKTDIEKAFEGVLSLKVSTFIGDNEYSAEHRAEYFLKDSADIFVMTPEKCALALRLSPELFQDISLCVFDECHLLGENGPRGIISEMVLAHISNASRGCAFLLLSALMENGKEIAEWLSSITLRETIHIEPHWRPTRTLRGIAGFESRSYYESMERATKTLSNMPIGRVSHRFSARLSILFNLVGAWTTGDPDDYIMTTVAEEGVLHLKRSKESGAIGRDTKSYLKINSRAIAQYYIKYNHNVIVFTPGNRFAPFSFADEFPLYENLDIANSSDPEVDALLSVAKFELGFESPLSHAIRQGISIHSSAMLDSERSASEIAYNRKYTKLMFATGTLAQGLNLPASICIIAGTELGYSAKSIPEAKKSKAQAQLLNAIGRAGRPGIANQGIAIVLPNRPAVIRSAKSARALREKASFLELEDSSFTVDSQLLPILKLGNEVIVSDDDDSIISDPAYSYLPVYDNDQGSIAIGILTRSFGYWRHRKGNPEISIERAYASFKLMSDGYLERVRGPVWLNESAYKAHFSLPVTYATYKSMKLSFDENADSGNLVFTESWLRVIVDVLKRLPSDVLVEALELKKPEFDEVGKLRPIWLMPELDQDPNLGWENFINAFEAYINGHSMHELSVILFGKPPKSTGRNSASSAVSRTFSYFSHFARTLSRFSGLMLAICEGSFENDSPTEVMVSKVSLECLRTVPLHLKVGCNSESTYAWFKYGLRHRCCARVLSDVAPLPNGLINERQVVRFVKSTCDKWIAEGIPSNEPSELLGAIVKLLEVRGYSNQT